MKKASVIILLFLVFFIWIVLGNRLYARARSPILAGAPMVSHRHISEPISLSPEPIDDTSPFSWMIRFYQKYVSPSNGNRCPMHPSCSEFAAQALKNNGEKGLPLIFDRLLRCGRDLEDYDLTFKRGRVLHDDPVIQRFKQKRLHASE